MDEDTHFSADDGEDSENIFTSPKKPSPSVRDSRDEFLDSLIEAELNDSNRENTEPTEQSTEMLVDSNAELFTDVAHETSTENVDENHELNESEMSVTDTDETNLNTTDGPETEQLPDSVSNDDKFVKPKDVLCHFPLGRIKRIVKADPEVPVISAESLFLISKATELFLRWLGKEVHGYTLQKKKKTIQLRDLNSAISENPVLEFLDGALE